MFDDLVVVYKTLGDLTFYVTGSENENELVLHNVLHAFHESVNMLLRCDNILDSSIQLHTQLLNFLIYSVLYACKAFSMNTKGYILLYTITCWLVCQVCHSICDIVDVGVLFW